METTYVLSSGRKSGSMGPPPPRTSPAKGGMKPSRVNVADMDSYAHTLSSAPSAGKKHAPSSSHGHRSEPRPMSSAGAPVQSDESALRMVYGSSRVDDRPPSSHKSTEERTKKKMEEIKLTFKAIRASECVDLLFLLDCTGSMWPYIAQVKNDIVALHEVLKLKHPNLDIVFGFIRYTDFDQGSARTSTLPFTRSTSDFKNFLSSIVADGGGDGPEDMFGGMDKIKSLPWRHESTKVVIHLADAPCHGTTYHNGQHDDHPRGDPNGITLDSLLTQLIAKDIYYYFGHIKLAETGKMVDIFDQRIKELSGNQKCINSFDSKDTSKLNEMIFQSVELSISTAQTKLTAKYTGASELSHGIRAYKIDKRMPDFNSLPLTPMLQTKFNLPTDLKQCVSSGYEIARSEISISIKMAPNPFAEGANRLAYYGVDQHGQKIVLKQSKYLGGRHNSLKRYYESMECQTIAAKFAIEFNKRLTKKEIKFTVAKVLQAKYSEKPQYLSIEALIEGDYQKFNSNHGWLKADDDGMHAILQTFSHWTHHESRGKAIVVDIQGVKTAKGYILTDPAIHCEDVLRFGATNLGKGGIIKFFETHKCNIHCQELGLTKPDFRIPSSASKPTTTTTTTSHSHKSFSLSTGHY